MAGNGVSSALDFRRYVFVNTDLTLHVHRQPEGEWVCLDARTTGEPNGIGFAASIKAEWEIARTARST